MAARNTVPEILQTEVGALAIVRAGKNDVNRTLAILRDAAGWLQSRGIQQWGWAFVEQAAEHISYRISSSEVYLAQREDEPVGVIRLQWADEEIWGLRGLDGLAGYIHMLAVTRAAGGHGVGASLIDWAGAAAVAHGKDYLRLDCLAANPGICAYYERQGFSPVGRKPLPDFDLQLFERRIGR